MLTMSSSDKWKPANLKTSWMKRQSRSTTCAESPSDGNMPSKSIPAPEVKAEYRQQSSSRHCRLCSAAVPPSTGGETMQEWQVNHLSLSRYGRMWGRQLPPSPSWGAGRGSGSGSGAATSACSVDFSIFFFSFFLNFLAINNRSNCYRHNMRTKTALQCTRYSSSFNLNKLRLKIKR